MITVKQFAAALGFAFVAVWIDAGFGYAVLCLVGALVFYAGASFYRGDFDSDVSDLQTRLGGVAGLGSDRPPPPAAPPPRASAPAPPPSPTASPRVR